MTTEGGPVDRDLLEQRVWPRVGEPERNTAAIDKNLRSERLDLRDVAEEARGQGIEKLGDIKWCVLETSGQMSFIKNDS